VRLALILEGGYSLPALSGGVVESLRALLGQAPGPDPLGASGSPEPDLTALIRRVRDRHPLFQG
jgi:acetoin utilization deacetylase AcuC-like enzyme